MIRNIENAKILKEYCEKLGRAGISAKIIDIARKIVEEDSYKKAVELTGEIRALTTELKFDKYWTEKMGKGFQRIVEHAEIMNNNKEA